MNELDLTTRQLVYYNSKKRSMVVAYLLGAVFGSFGVHAFYVGGNSGIFLGAITCGLLYYSFIYPEFLLVYLLFVLSGVVYTYFLVTDRNSDLLVDASKIIDKEE